MNEYAINMRVQILAQTVDEVALARPSAGCHPQVLFTPCCCAATDRLCLSGTVYGQCDLPEAEDGVVYTQVAAGNEHTVFLRSDGQVAACGRNHVGQCDLPEAEDGVSYVQVAAGGGHTVLLRSDGRVVACGWNRYGQCSLPEAGDGIWYTQISVGWYHTVLLRSDGRVVACGCDWPEAEDGVSYKQVEAGCNHTVLLRADGQVVALGDNRYGQCDLPEADVGVSYTQVAAGLWHTVLLRGDGRVTSCGDNSIGQRDLPETEDGVRYTQVAAGGAYGPFVELDPFGVRSHTVLLRSDGRVVACGDNEFGQCDVPELEAGVTYMPNSAAADFVVQLLVEGPASGRTAVCRDLSGNAIATWTIGAEDLQAAVLSQVRVNIVRPGVRLHVVLPDAGLLAHRPGLTWAAFFGLALLGCGRCGAPHPTSDSSRGAESVRKIGASFPQQCRWQLFFRLSSSLKCMFLRRFPLRRHYFRSSPQACSLCHGQPARGGRFVRC